MHTHLRNSHLHDLVAARALGAAEFSRQFLQPPLYNTQFGRGFGTLYSTAFYPQRGECEYLWPEKTWRFGFNKFDECEYHINFVDPEGYPKKSQTYGEIYTVNPTPVLNF